MSERGGAALVIHPSVTVEDRGIRGNGSMAWAKVKLGDTRFGVASIYGPHDGEGKMNLFEWLKQKADGEHWLLMGDWNLVLLPEDSAGPTPLLKGRLLEGWKAMEQRWELSDLYLQAQRCEGPRFTRQVKRGRRLDQPRRRVVRTHRAHSTRREGSIASPARRARIKEEWQKGWELSQDPVVAWELGWGKIREVFKEFRREDRSKLSKLKEMQSLLAEWREQLNQSATEDQMAEYSSFEKSVHDLQLLEASIARRRSRVKWTSEGDAGTKYFFGCLKSKQLQERILTLEDANGELQKDEGKILNMVQDYYGELYRQDQSVQDQTETREQVLQLVDNTVTEKENENLTDIPGLEEVERIMSLMSPGKSPGLDGLTIEVLKITWEWMKYPCVRMLKEVWTNKRIGKTNKVAVIKLLPKGEGRTKLKQWRPISLLSLTYRLIGKIISERLKKIIPKLVDDDQTGFVAGRSIMDNVLSLKMCQDVTNITGEPSIFCKLDFEKAFDRVHHQYLWETFAKMRFSWNFIQLLQMLVGGGSAKVYLNGRFTETIQLERGVPQGCPVSPLLFALTTQPLMRLLREAERSGVLKGVTIPKGCPLLHKLFADDSGVAIAAGEENFRSLTQVIECFEKISGARLNLAKSVILPMVLDRSEAWLQRTGCRVLGREEEETYLGCKIGKGIRSEHHTRDLGSKITKRLSHWANNFLTWTSKVILLRHVLRSLPVYQFLGLGLENVGYKQLEVPCRVFLWEVNPEGRAKTALISWEKVTKQQENGGLGINPFRNVSEPLKMRYVGRLMGGETSDWANMARFVINHEMRNRSRSTEFRFWSVEEGLLMLPMITTPKDSAVRFLMKSWTRFRKFLTLDTSKWSLPGSLTLKQLSALIKRYWRGRIPFSERIVLPLMKKLGYSVICHLKDENNCWKNFRQKLGEASVEVILQQAYELHRFQSWIKIIALESGTLQESSSWRWEGDSQRWEGWNQSTQFWNKKLQKVEQVEELSSKWQGTSDRLTWKKPWRLLWSSRGSHGLRCGSGDYCTGDSTRGKDPRKCGKRQPSVPDAQAAMLKQYTTCFGPAQSLADYGQS
ncbi:hypothetical protein R1sor_021830 [Riccia sorocarpa]|uniref:Reverse transcriptase domain-containing protein n=1 Tax=Riccia sorocarpa TaxID=122646 RepID=A0ABD3GNY1_9MARC